MNGMTFIQIQSTRNRARKVGRDDIVVRLNNVLDYLQREHDNEPEDPRDIVADFNDD